MKRPFRTVACVILILAVFSSFAISQELNDAFKNFEQSYNDEFFSTPEQRQRRDRYIRDSNRLLIESAKNSARSFSDNATNIVTDMAETMSSSTTPGDAAEYQEDAQNRVKKSLVEISVDQDILLQKPLADVGRKIFPEKEFSAMQQRQFQLRESMMSRLKSFDNPKDVVSLMRIEDMYSVTAQPDFLELTAEQEEWIARNQKEMATRLATLNERARYKDPAKTREELQLLRTFAQAKTPGEREEILVKIERFETEMLTAVAPQLKEILLKSHEDYMRVLTDAQKAKIKTVMDDMPGYMQELFAEIDKQGGGLSILQSWQPGLGVPDIPNPNREAPRDRNDSDRAFPQ